MNFVPLTLNISPFFPIPEVVFNLAISEKVSLVARLVFQHMLLQDVLDHKVSTLDTPCLVPLLLARALPSAAGGGLFVLARYSNLLEHLLELTQVIALLHGGEH